MRILHVVHDFLPLVRAGVEVYTYQLARAQAVRHEVAVFHASYVPGARDCSVSHGSWEGVRTIEVVNNRLHRRFEETWKNPAMEARFADVLAAFKPDAVHFQHLMHHSEGYPRLARGAGARTVFTIHDFHAVCPSGGQFLVRNERICPGPGESRCPACYAASALHPGPAERALASRAFSPVVPLARRVRATMPSVVDRTVGLLKKAGARLSPPATWAQIRMRNAALLAAIDACDVVLAPSRFVGRSLNAYGMTSAFVHSDYGFVPPTPVRRPAPGPHRALRVGFIGPATRHKGLEILLRAAEVAGDGIEVHVHGSVTVDPALAARLKNAHPGATFHGPYDPGALDRIFASLDLLVVPSMWPENSPLVIHEAFLRGVPVAASHIGGIPELVRDGVSGRLFSPGDIEALAHILRGLRDRREDLGRMARKAPVVKSMDDDALGLERRFAMKKGG